MFDNALLSRLEYSALAARRARGRSLATRCSRRLPAGGTEVTGWRDYVPGDDYRHIDWIGCARRDELLTREFASADDVHVYLLLDCSPSMQLGSPSKFDLARLVAAALGYRALRDLDRLSVTAFADGIVADLPPIRHTARVARLLRFLEQLDIHGAETDLAKTAESFVRRYQRHGQAVVISDLYDRNGFQRALNILRHRGYQPCVVQVYDPRDAEPALLGDVELFDVESGAAVGVTVTEETLRRYRAVLAEFHGSVRRYCAEHGIGWMQLASDTPTDRVLAGVFSDRVITGDTSQIR